MTENINGVNMTLPYSNVSVIFTGACYVVQFPYRKDYKPSHFYKNKLQEVKGAQWNTRVKNQWTIPKTSFGQLKEKFDTNIRWKNIEDIEKQIQEFRFKEETLPDVLNRADKSIDFSYMKIKPYNFQQLAVAWASTPKGKRANIYGGLLADEMGLGKTIEALAIAGHFKRNFGVKRVLIVCLATLKFQISQEIERFTNEDYKIINGGSATQKKKAFEKRLDQYREVRNNDIFFTIVNYELVRQKHKDKQGGGYIDLVEILNNEYDMIIIDEAHRIQNPESETYKAIIQIKAKYKLLMTGTPAKKKVADIFALIDYIDPNILSSDQLSFNERLADFQEKFLLMQYNNFALPKKLWGPQGEKNSALLNKWLSPYMLGREAKDVSDELPKQTETIIPAEWHPLQEKLYKALVNDMKRLKSEATAENLTEDQRNRLENEQNALLTYLLEVSDTPELLMRSPSNLSLKKLALVPEFQPFVKEAYQLLKEYKSLSEQVKAIREQGAILNKEMKEDSSKKEENTRKIAELKTTIESTSKKIKVILEQYEQVIQKNSFMVPKLETTLDKVEDCVVANEQKVVIFSKFEKMTQILHREIDKLLNIGKNGRRVSKDKQVNIMMYTGKTGHGCKWKSELDKQKKESKNLSCFNCPFNAECDTRTKSAYYFQNDPKTQVIILSEAGNTGVNLQQGKYSINYDLPDVRADYDQRNKRTARLGSPHKNVFVYNIVLTGSRDAIIAKKLEKQKQSIDKVFKNDEEKEAAILEATKQMEQEFIDSL